MAELFTVSVALGASNTGAFLENETTTDLYTITFTRSGGDAPGLAQDLEIFFTVAGTAVVATSNADPELRDFTFINDADGLPIFPDVNNNNLTSVIIPAGQSTVSVWVAPLDDFQVEGTETVTIALAEPVQSPPGYVLDTTDTSLTLSITDNEIGPVVAQVSVAATDNIAEEEDNTNKAQFTFTRSNSPDLNQPLTVNFTVSGTAVAGTDYVDSIGQTITFAAGEFSKTIDVTAIDDIDFDQNETVIVTINPSDTAQYTIGTSSAIATIADDVLVLPSVSISANPLSVREDEDTPADYPTFTITRTNNNLNTDLEVFYTVSGTATPGAPASGDYLQLNGSVIILAGQPSATVTITPFDDFDASEGNETITVTLFDPADASYIFGNNVTATVTISDDDNPLALPQVTVVASDPNAAEVNVADPSVRDTATFTFTFTRTVTNNDQLPLTVNYTIAGTGTAGTDYLNNLGGSITFAPGELTKTITLTAIDDVALEGPETVTVSITPDAGGAYTIGTARVATVFIIDNENNAPTLNAAILDDFVLNEDAGAVVLRNGNNRTFAQLVQDAFADEDINVPENENETLKAIRFVTLTASGNLTLNGVLVTENQVVEFATNAEVSEFLDSLRYEPDPDFFGQSEDLQSRPDRFKIVANDGFADSRETDVVINVRPVNDAPFYVLPGEDSFNGGSAAQPNDFYQDSSIIGNLAFSGGDTRNFALRPGVRVSIRDFVQGGANEPNPVVGPENERVNTANSVLPAGNQTLTFSTDLVGDEDIFDEAPTIAADGTLTFKLKDVIPGGFGTAQVRLSAQDNGGTANNGIDTLTKGFFVVTGDENALSNVIQTFETPVGGTGSLLYNTSAFPVGSLIRVNLQQDVLRLGTNGYLDNIVGLYEIADPDGGIDLGKDLDGDGQITTTEEKAAKDGIADLTPSANMSAADRAAYARGALENHLTNGSLQTFNLRAGSDGDPNKNSTVSSFNRQGQSSTGLQTGVVVEGGKLYAPFIIANGGTLISSGSGGTIAGAIGTFLTAVNPNNNAVSNITSPVAYFSFNEVNPDGEVWYSPMSRHKKSEFKK